MLGNMSSKLLTQFRQFVADNAFVAVRVLVVAPPVVGSTHPYKYSLALIIDQECVMRYDNERGKGDHRHEGSEETPYKFSSLDALYADFRADVRRIINGL